MDSIYLAGIAAIAIFTVGACLAFLAAGTAAEK
jgi:hypothetical protein